MAKTHFFMLDKSACQLLPTDRPFSELEALCSYELDRNNGKQLGYKSYARVWGWDVRKVKRFIEAVTSENGLTRAGNRNLKTPVKIIQHNASMVPLKQRTEAGYEGAMVPQTPKHISMVPPMVPPVVPPKHSIEAGSEGATVPPMVPPMVPHTIKTKTKTKDLLCTERCSEAAEKIKIPLKDYTEFIVHNSYLTELERAFPELDVEGCLKRARMWCINNPNKRKTLKGVKRFIGNWLNKAHADLDTTEKVKKDCSVCRFQNTNVCQLPGPCIEFSPKDMQK